MIYRTSAAHEEGGQREFAVRTVRFVGVAGRVTALECVRDGQPLTLPAEVVLLALGFTGVVPSADFSANGLGAAPTISIDAQFRTATPGVYACGDAHRGASLVVWAIAEGRQAATAIDAALS